MAVTHQYLWNVGIGESAKWRRPEGEEEKEKVVANEITAELRGVAAGWRSREGHRWLVRPGVVGEKVE